eukprot:jgi/Hompol1/3509/HPOL_003282-RA
MIVSIAVAALAVLAPLAQAQLPPGANPSLLDPVAYAALIQWKPCPNVGNQQNPPIDCNYPSTPTSGDVTWTCPAGFYCMGPSRKDACTPGFYCPVNAAQPLYCPRKFACSNDTTSISVCPKNYFCPVGTVSPFSCWFLAYCPAGSYEASKFAILLLFIVVAAAIYLVFYWKAKADEQRRHRHVMFQEEANRNLVATDKPAIKHFFMDVATGKIPSEFDPAFDIKDLFTYWNKTRKGENPFANAKRMTIEEAIENREKFKRGELRATAADGTKVVPKIEAPKFRDYYGWTNYITDGIASMGREWGVWAFDVLVEFGEWLISIVNTIICRVDPIRETCAYHLQIWYLLRRAALQVYKDPQSIIIDMFLHFASGVFISTAVQNFKFLGAMPGSICATAPINLQWQCGRPEDHLKEAGMFVALGVLFAGISVGVNTFGREKVVYWRDTANGMNTIPYYLAKFIVDFPRVLLGATMYFIAVLIFFSFKQFPGSLFSIIICLYYGAFAMGYWISTAFPLSKAALIGTGFALLWALVLSGVIPSLDDVVDYPDALQWLWKVSAPRWGIEAFWLKEVSSLWWRERNLPPINQYQWDDYLPAFKHMLLIAVGWNVLAFLGLKLFNRSKQK